jgi:hypothetical protein
MQRPILKDGVVVNVVELDDDTMVTTKARHKELTAAEDAEYQAKIDEWRIAHGAHQAKITAAAEALAMARMTLGTVKAKADKEKNETKAAAALRQILTMEKDISAKEEDLAKIQGEPSPPKPVHKRGKRWFHPDGVEVGPAGGNIGDIWDGEKYVRPADTSPPNVAKEDRAG